MMIDDLSPIGVIVQGEIDAGMGRSEAISFVAKKLNTAIPTLYKWLKEDDRYVRTTSDTYIVYREIKAVERACL